MSDATEFTITLLSNARGDGGINTLSSFSNNLPIQLNLNQQDDWHVSLDGLGFSTRFYNIKNVTMPSFKLITRKKVETISPEKIEKMTDFYISAGYEKSFVESMLIQSENFDKFLLHKLKIRGKREPAGTSENKIRKVDNTITKTVSRFIFPLINVHATKKNYFEILDNVSNLSFTGRFMSLFDINNHFTAFFRRDIPLKSVVEDGKEFSIYAVDSEKFENYAYTLMIHEKAMENFKFPTTLRKTMYQGACYFVKDFNSKYDVLTGESKLWYYIFPEIIKVQCEQVKEQIHNSSLEKNLAVVCPVFKSDATYYCMNFEHDNFYPLSQTSLDKIKITIKDIDDNIVQFLPGPATFVRLKFKKMNFPKFFNVRLSDNKSKFKCKLAQPLYLDNKWKVALTSISFPTEFLPLPLEPSERKVTCYRGKKHPWTVYELPNIVYTNNDHLIGLLNQTFEDSDISLSLVNGKLLITAKTLPEQDGDVYQVMFSSPIAEIMGFEREIDPGDNTATGVKIWEHDGICVVQWSKSVEVSPFLYNMDINRLKPEYLMVYANIIDHNIVGNKMVKLLRIVPLSKHKENTYDTIEFSKPEYHSLESTYFDSVDIEIRDHAGSLVNFIDKKNVMNLYFSCE